MKGRRVGCSACWSVSDAFRYDAYGQTIGRYPAAGSSVPVRFRGLLDLAPTADPDLAGSGSDPAYLMGARVYSRHSVPAKSEQCPWNGCHHRRRA
jgi:hypothetical protein